MKKVLSLLVLLLSLQYVSAQGLKVVYEEVANPYLGRDVSKELEKQTDNPEIRAHLEKQMKNPTVMISELLVNKGVSIYTKKGKKSNEKEAPIENERVKATVNHQFSGTSAIYVDYLDSIYINQMTFDDKIYIMESPVYDRMFTWEITSEQQNILGYNCIKATKTSGVEKKIGTIESRPQRIVAWYCPDIPVSAGPEHHIGLPGLILKVEMNEGVHVYNAVSIEPLAPDTEIVKPENGEKISSEELLEVVQEFNAKQIEKMNRRGGKVIRIQR
jgi:GLPGLI family protein